MVLRGGRNQSTRRKSPILGGQLLPCHMPMPGIDFGSQRDKRGFYRCANQAPCAIQFIISVIVHLHCCAYEGGPQSYVTGHITLFTGVLAYRSMSQSKEQSYCFIMISI